MDAKDEIYGRLNALGIPYERVTHDAVHTMADCRRAEAALHACVPKNLFLTPRNESAFYLCLVHPDKAFHTAQISRQIGASRLSFASPERLLQRLRTTPGAVSPMGLLFPEARGVPLLIDRALDEASRLGFHPNDPTETLAMARADFFHRFLPALSIAPVWIDVL